MPKRKNINHFIVKDYNKILGLVSEFSTTMTDYLKAHPKSEYILLYKDLTHSDLGTFGKLIDSSKIENKFDDNYLYYLSSKQMEDYYKKIDGVPETAHQSCISLKEELYELTNLPNPRRVEPYLINDYYDVYLVNDSMKYFTSKYTKIVFDKLGKNSDKWKFDDSKLIFSDSDFTEIELHCAVHGLGMSDDEFFHSLRHNMFKGDSFALLFEKNEFHKKMFILLQKNPAFYSIVGIANDSYVRHLERTKQRMISSASIRDVVPPTDMVEDEIDRRQQAAWRKELAKEMMGFSANDDEVFCPITYITANFNELGPLFIASHIKAFSDPNTTNEEKYDINNGLLLNANADALFDKHLISVDENKNLVFSYLLKDNQRLIQDLRLYNEIFKPVLNDKRMVYLKYHKQVFDKKEIERKTNNGFSEFE